MTTYNDLFEQLLLKKIAEQRERSAEALLTGNLADFIAYKEMTGFVRGLNTVEELCNEVRSDMEKR